jgi:thiamine-monophosphate kinase
MNPPHEPTLRDIGEDALIERIARLVPLPAGVAAGPGDDCAVVDESTDPQDDDVLTLLKTDAIVESIHYPPDTDPQRVGWKAIMRLVSDFAAMGGAPDRFLSTIAMPPERAVAWVDGLYQGMARALEWSGAKIAGGETSAVPTDSAAVISIAATGRVKRKHLTLRSTAMPGDAIYVTGRLGGSFASGRHLDFFPRLAEAAWLVRQFKPSSMMDLSDGLAADLPKLARASGVGFTLDRAAVPRHAGVELDAALNDGEDFELLFTHRGDPSALASAWKSAFPDVLLTQIGEITGREADPIPPGGWHHFSS